MCEDWSLGVKLDGGRTPLRTWPRRYCNPASLVLFQESNSCQIKFSWKRLGTKFLQAIDLNMLKSAKFYSWFCCHLRYASRKVNVQIQYTPVEFRFGLGYSGCHRTLGVARVSWLLEVAWCCIDCKSENNPDSLSNPKQLPGFNVTVLCFRFTY